MDIEKQIHIDGDNFEVYEVPVWSVYILMDSDSIIYIGCTNNIKRRIWQHKSNRDFDSYVIYYSSSDKFKAEMMERRTIGFCDFFYQSSIAE